jgi:hypothetical protein
MSAVEIKTELQQLIENETDLSVLQAIRTILLKTGLNPMLKEKLTQRALKSEEDIKSGRVFTKEEVVQRTRQKPDANEKKVGLLPINVIKPTQLFIRK